MIKNHIWYAFVSTFKNSYYEPKILYIDKKVENWFFFHKLPFSTSKKKKN